MSKSHGLSNFIWSIADLLRGLFESVGGNTQFVARYFFHHFLGAEDIACLAQFKDWLLTDDEVKALIVVPGAGVLSNGSYRELTRLDTLAGSLAFRRLRTAGVT